MECRIEPDDGKNFGFVVYTPTNFITLYFVDFHFYVKAVDQGQNEISCTPRPRISEIRPHQSIFHHSSAMSVLLQSICHLFYLSYGHYVANQVERKYGKSFTKGVSIKLANPELFGALGEMFKYRTTTEKMEETSIFRKKRFKPNFVTNTIFILSCFQNTMITLVNHVGRPFNGSVLESRTFCFAVGTSILFCLCATTEAFKPLNQFLELAPNHSRSTKVLLLAIMAFNGMVPLILDAICTSLLDEKRWNVLIKSEEAPKSLGHAADMEQNLLMQERNMNTVLMAILGIISLFVVKMNL